MNRIIKVLDQVTETEKEQILKLRKQAYHDQYGETFDRNGVNWNTVDSRSLHLVLIAENKWVSALRLTLSDLDSDFHRILLINKPKNAVAPFAFLARAATHQNFHNQHCHSLLRASALKLCLHKNITSIWGTVPPDALRISQLEKLGYNIEETSLNNPGVLNMTVAKVVSLVGLDKIEITYHQLLERLKLQDRDLEPHETTN